MNQNFIDNVSITLQPGASAILHLGGDYFELVECPDPVSVVLSDRNGAQTGLLRNVGATDHLKGTPYSTIQITSATLQTVKFAYGTGEGGSRRLAGAISLTNQQGGFAQGRTSVGSGAAVQIRPQNTARRRILVQNNTAAQNLRVTLDGSAPSAANGLRLIPGDLLDLTDYCPTGEIRAIFESGGAADVEWAEG